MEDIYKIAANGGISDTELKEALEKSLAGRTLQKVLILPPDFTRFHSQAGLITSIYYHLLTERGVLTQFDGGVASCEVQVNKPDPQIYKALLKKYQLKASECVFIDDRLENVQAAFALGFAGIQMKDSVGTLIRSLATCNVTLR